VSLPLEGIRVLDLSRLLPGGFCSLLLADFGADVLKVEDTGMGDYIRWSPPFYEGAHDSAKSALFLSLNRNKRSIRLDLKQERGREALLRLVREYDVVLESFRPGVLDRLGVGYERMREENPGIVYCAISGFGQDGPYRDLPGYDTLGVAMGGLLSHLTDMAAPDALRISLADHLTGIFACHAILAALYARAQTGKGQMVETSLLQSVTSFVQSPAARYLKSGKPPREHKRSNLAAAFVAGDGKPFVVHLSTPPKFWQGLTDAVGRPELRDDPRFDTRELRVANYRDYQATLASIFATAPRQEWLDRLRERDVPCGPIYDIQEVFDDPQVRHLGLPIELHHPQKGTVRLSGSAVTLRETPVSYATAPPMLGEHTEEILRAAGYSTDDIERLAHARVI
jgi:crotonobetainyl-CoA:carnitine CoA-transferase CaiB-like acyl-CoA transferase